MTDWYYFFATVAGASSALNGLIFVGVSVNHNKIILSSSLPARALLSIIFLFNNLIQALLFLIPHQSMFSLGIELSCISFLTFLIIEALEIKILKTIEKQRKKQQIIGFIFSQMALTPFIVCSINILLSANDAIYWIVPGIILSFFRAIINAWVFLIEIHR